MKLPATDLPGTPVRYDRVPVTSEHLTGAAQKVFRGLMRLYRPGEPVRLEGEDHNLTNEEGAAACQVHPSTFRAAIADLKSTVDPVTGEPYIAIVGTTNRRRIFILSRPAQAGETPVGTAERRALGRRKGARWDGIVDGGKARAGTAERRALGRHSSETASSLGVRKGDKTNVNVSRSREDAEGKPEHVAEPPLDAEEEGALAAAPDLDPEDPDTWPDAELLARIAELEARPRPDVAIRCLLGALRGAAKSRGLAIGGPVPMPVAPKAPGCPRTVPALPTPAPEPARPVAPAPRPPDPPPAACPDPNLALILDPESIDTETLIRRLANPTFSDDVVELVARRLADRLGDRHSVAYYRRICRKVRRGELPPGKLLAAWRQARSPTASRPGAVFAAAVRPDRSMPLRC